MSIMRTDLRETIDSAKRQRFEPAAGIAATNTEDAVIAVQANVVALVTPPVTSVAAASYTVLPTDRIIEVNFAGNVAITLAPASARAGLDLQVKDISGGLAAGPFAITITPDVADVGGIDGQATLVIATDFESFKLRPRALVWRVGP